jgi:ankyrin repeat protein
VSAHKKWIFISSSSDLAKSRQAIDNRLDDHLRRLGLDHLLEPYLWEIQTDDGKMLNDRVAIQAQLVDTFNTFTEVPLVVCLFGERCGVPLQDTLPVPEWEGRIASWRAGPDGPGLVHPWPHTQEEQDAVLAQGGFPLTGTVFELISACEADPEGRQNLVMGYVANTEVRRGADPELVEFNQHKHGGRLDEKARNPAERKRTNREDYTPQTQALFNLLAYLGDKVSAPRRYDTESDMVADILRRVEQLLRKRFKSGADRNPFKDSLEHWSIDDKNLPGRGQLAQDILKAIASAQALPEGRLFLIEGHSGCGKSSLLQSGVLAPLRDQGHKVVPIRPTDLVPTRTGDDELDVMWALLCDAIGLLPKAGPRPGRDERMAKQLLKALDDAHHTLVIGLDQFEEVLDELALSPSEADRDRKWWMLLRFLSRLAPSPRVILIATLETTRRDTFNKLRIDHAVGRQRTTFDADVGPDDVARIAQEGFAHNRLVLADEVLQAIKEAWQRFLSQQGLQGMSASPLPLACLRFAQLYDRCAHLAPLDPEVTPHTSATNLAFRQAQGDALVTLSDLGPDPTAFEDLITHLAQGAWVAAGQALLTDWSPDSARDACHNLTSFLDPLIGVEPNGHMRLFAVPEGTSTARENALRQHFRHARLLVPAATAPHPAEVESSPMVRLVHQAVVDRWAPARGWFAWRKDLLSVEARMRVSAKAWHLGGRRPLSRSQQAQVTNAAEVLELHRNHAAVQRSSIDDDDAELLAYCQALFSRARNPAQTLSASLWGNTFAHLASAYHLVDVLEAFWQQDPAFVNLRTMLGRDLFIMAAWRDGPAIAWLLDKAVHPVPDNDGWHPIVGAIQTGAMANYHLLLPTLGNVGQAAIGPEDVKPLHMAASYGNTLVMQDLLGKGCPDRQRDEGQRTPLMFAAMNGQVEAFKMLLNDETIQDLDVQGCSALHFAAANGCHSIVHALLHAPALSEAEVARAIQQRSGPEKDGWTPLALAASYRHAECLRELLQVDDPRNAWHRGQGGESLFHHILSGQPKHLEDKLGARRAIQVLLDDGRLDPCQPNLAGMTAFEQASAQEFPEARQLLRQHMAIPYEAMSEEMRRADLESARTESILALVRKAPQALTTTHGGQQTGLDILLSKERFHVLSTVLREALLPEPSLLESLPKLVRRATGKAAKPLRHALWATLHERHLRPPELPMLLNLAMQEEDTDAIQKLSELGAPSVLGMGKTGLSVFHEAALAGNAPHFEALARLGTWQLPIDDLGRRPSELAASHLVQAFEALESRLFTPVDATITMASVRQITPPPPATVGRAPYLVLEQVASAERLTGAAREGALQQLRASSVAKLPHARTTQTLRHRLPFYADAHLLECHNPQWPDPAARLCYLTHEGTLYRLEGASPPIHEVNAKAGIHLDAHTVLPYLAFFCFFVRGEDGPFLIVDRPDNPLLPTEVPRARVEQLFRPPKVYGQDDQGAWLASALVYYADAIFFADFRIEANGMIHMQEDVPLAADLPARVHAPLSIASLRPPKA